MARYRMLFRASVAADLRFIPNKDVARILARIRKLADEPRAVDCEKLSGRERYRVRVGVYRIIYEIEDDAFVVVVVKVAHRREVYRPK